MVSKLAGLWNLDEGMAVTAGMLPMGIGLQEPVVIWRPLVMVWPEQKLMKLFVDVAAALCPVTGGFWPSSVVWITDESSVSEDWSAPAAAAAAARGRARAEMEGRATRSAETAEVANFILEI
jgi:hypothetical protein